MTDLAPAAPSSLEGALRLRPARLPVPLIGESLDRVVSPEDETSWIEVGPATSVGANQEHQLLAKTARRVACDARTRQKLLEPLPDQLPVRLDSTTVRELRTRVVI
jgi:hypothetical protein